MIIGDNIVYLELQKTGSTYTSNILSSIPNQNWQSIGKHNTYKDVFKNDLIKFENKLKIGNIRNPWDWYVSLWAYGCMHKGAIYNRLAKNLFQSCKEHPMPTLSLIYRNPISIFKKRSKWRELYSDSNDKASFNVWLKLILKNSNEKLNIKFHNSLFSRNFGLLTYRYLALFTYDFDRCHNILESFDEVENFDKKNNFLDLVIKTENINYKLLENCKVLGVKEEDLRAIISSFKSKRNSSQHKRAISYYDNESKDLVREKDAFIINKYGYTFD